MTDRSKGWLLCTLIPSAVKAAQVAEIVAQVPVEYRPHAEVPRTKADRIKFIRAAREKYWDSLPEPSKPVERPSSVITARDANEWLRGLPRLQDAGDL